MLGATTPSILVVTVKSTRVSAEQLLADAIAGKPMTIADVTMMNVS